MQLMRCYKSNGHHYVAAWECNAGDSVDGPMGWSSEVPTSFEPNALYSCFRADIGDYLTTTSEEECYRNGYDVIGHLGYVRIDEEFARIHIFHRYAFPVYRGEIIIRHSSPVVIIRRGGVVVHPAPGPVVIVVGEEARRHQEEVRREEENRRRQEEARRRDEENRRREEEARRHRHP